MATPHDPFGNSERDGGLPRYEATNHPEDQPGFGATLPSASASMDSAAAGYATSASAPLVPQDRLDVWGAIRWAFVTTVNNWKLWILGSVAFLVLGILLAGLFGLATVDTTLEDGSIVKTSANLSSFGSFLHGVIGILITPFVLRLALFQVDDPATGWCYLGKEVKFISTIAAEILNCVLGVIVGIICMLPFMGMILTTQSQMNDYNLSALMPVIIVLVVIMLLFLVLSLLLSPLYSLILWFVVDGKTGFWGACVAGLRAGKANYLPMLVFMLVLDLVSVVFVVVTLGLGAFVVLPIQTLATAHLFRQISARADYPAA